MKKLVISTNNFNKVKEIKDILAGLNYEVYSKKDLGLEEFDVEETGTTLKENAIIKADALKEKLSEDYIVIADDSGLFVDVLGGEPGVYSARYAGEQHSDADNNKKLLSKLKDIPRENRTAEFISVIALVEDGKEPITVEGRVKGHITEKERGTNGFGYDSLFVPVGEIETFGELESEHKNKISHRHNALINLYKVLKEKE